MKCDVRQYSDTTRCETCGLEWDTNDPAEPLCPAQKLAALHAVENVRGELHAIARRYTLLELAAVSLGVLVLIYFLSTCAK